MKSAAAAQAVTVSILDVTLASASYSPAGQTVNGSVTISIDALESKSSGWRVVVQGSAFGSDQGGDNSIPAGNLSIMSVGSTVLIEGKAGKKSAAAAAPLNLPSSLDAARTVATAASGAGNGLYQQSLALQLAIPGAARPGSYTGTVTVTVWTGP